MSTRPLRSSHVAAFSQVLLALVLTTFAVSVNAFLQSDIPTYEGVVTDTAKVLLPAERFDITQTIRNYEQATGFQFAVLTVVSVKPESIEMFSKRVANGWGLGRSNSGDAALVVVAVNDHQVRVELGRKMAHRIPETFASQVINEVMIPEFRRGRFALGITAGLDRLMDKSKHPDSNSVGVFSTTSLRHGTENKARLKSQLS